MNKKSEINTGTVLMLVVFVVWSVVCMPMLFNSYKKFSNSRAELAAAEAADPDPIVIMEKTAYEMKELSFSNGWLTAMARVKEEVTYQFFDIDGPDTQCYGQVLGILDKIYKEGPRRKNDQKRTHEKVEGAGAGSKR